MGGGGMGGPGMEGMEDGSGFVEGQGDDSDDEEGVEAQVQDGSVKFEEVKTEGTEGSTADDSK